MRPTSQIQTELIWSKIRRTCCAIRAFLPNSTSPQAPPAGSNDSCRRVYPRWCAVPSHIGSCSLRLGTSSCRSSKVGYAQSRATPGESCYPTRVGHIDVGTLLDSVPLGSGHQHDGEKTDCQVMPAMPQPVRDSVIQLGRACLAEMPVLILGSGASVPFGLPTMQCLARHLSKSDPPPPDTEHPQTLWNNFLSELKNGVDLESALHNCNLTEGLTDHIVNETWSLISAADQALFEKLIIGRSMLPLSRLYRHLFNSTHRTLSVVTTNYDRVAEYAADCAGFSHYTGFTNGYLRSTALDGEAYQRPRTTASRTVNVWKVHGCLDWFRSDLNRVTAAHLARAIPPTLSPAIIAPGIAKFEKTHQEPFRSIITRADAALRRASAYLCIGFGFNDEHIPPVLLERWQQGDALLVIITKKLSEAARRLLDRSTGNRFLAIEESGTGTLVWSHDYPSGELLENQDLWSLDSFLDKII